MPILRKKHKQPLRPVPAALDLTSPVELIAAEPADGDKPAKPRRFSLKAYTGDRMTVRGWWSPVVVDLAGLKTPKKIPVLIDHTRDAEHVLGQADEIVKARDTLTVAGDVLGTSDTARQVIELADAGFTWESSVGLSVESVEEVREGTTVKANGRTFTGPVLIARKSRLKEVSFVVIGAAENSAATIAATLADRKDHPMQPFAEWLQAAGFDADTLTDAQRATLQKQYDAELTAAAPTAPPAGDVDTLLAAAPPAAPPPTEPAPAADPMAAQRELQAAETERVAAVRTACAGNHPTIEAEAIRDGWTEDKTSLAVLRASAPAAPSIHMADNAASADILEAGLRLGGGQNETKLAAEYGDETLSKASRYRRMRPAELIAACCMLEGMPAPAIGASPRDLAAAGFSTVTLPNLLSNLANKTALAAYNAVPSAAVRVAKKLTANDFKTHTGIRMSADSMFEEVGATGEIKHMTVGEDPFTYSVDTFAKIFGLTRRDFVNDDLGAFTQLPQLMGRGAALKRESMFWTLVLANTGTFFGSGNSNYFDGASSVLSGTSLGTAVSMFLKQQDAHDNPIAVMPSILCVPPELKVTADELYVSTKQVGGSSKSPDANTHAGRYEPVVSPYLSNSSITGYSTTGWYLFGDPDDVAAFGIAYLNGVEHPVVEEVELSGEYLGRAWRGYIDLGVCQVESAGGVKSKGAA
jgi:hypothetical protein